MPDTFEMNRTSFALGFAPGEALRKLARVVVVVAALALVGYAGFTAWHVLGELRTVRLSDFARALDFVSVGDAVLCVIGWKLGAELLRAVTDRRRNAA